MFCCPVLAENAQMEKELLMADVEGITIELNSDYENIIKKMRLIAPEYVKLLEDSVEDNEVKLIKMRSYLAQLSYEHYKNKFLSDLKATAEKTGRELKYKDYSGYEEYWLARGKLDEKKCFKDGWQICHWPDGFIEYGVRIQEHLSSDTEQGMLDKLSENILYQERVVTFTKDIPEENKRISCDVSLQNNATHDDNGYTGENLRIDVVCNTYKYDEYYAWLNQEVEDTLAGKYDIVSVEKQPKGSPFGKKLYSTRSNESPEEWKSNALPSVEISGRDFNLSRQIYVQGGTDTDIRKIDENTLHALWTIEFQELEKQMKEFAPKVVVSAADKNDVERERIYKNWLAEQAAKDAVKQVIQEMYRASRETGRMIKKENISGDIVVTDSIDSLGGMYWLDRGELDSEKCLIGKTGFYKCPYPKNYQEKQLYFDVDESYIDINLDEDVIEDGQWRHISTHIQYHCDAENIKDSNECSFEVFKFIYNDYKDYYRMLSEENEVAQTNYALQKLSKRKLRKIQQECNRDTSVKSDVCKNWADVETAHGISVKGAMYNIIGG